MRHAQLLLGGLALGSLVGCNASPGAMITDGGDVQDLPRYLPDCAISEPCNCVDGTNFTVSDCGSGPGCGSACAMHGGVEPFGQCPAGESFCQDRCRKPSAFDVDSNNCGACGSYCVELTNCVAGACTVALPDAGFACRKDADCSEGQACVLNPTSNGAPYCATSCEASNPDACPADWSCAPAIDVGTSAKISACASQGQK